ncbi:hypothetical protein [Sinomonas halotolerans]|uniref:Uncharacterized protein n=1 Tax=Sinomonas halotolerans TaxID=1644133 RepID=A0ABU9WW10_9MICC
MAWTAQNLPFMAAGSLPEFDIETDVRRAVRESAPVPGPARRGSPTAALAVVCGVLLAVAGAVFFLMPHLAG